MAVNFGAQMTDMAPLQSAVTPKEGVRPAPSLLSSLGGVFDQVEAALDKRNQDRASRTLAEFTQQQLNVADALDQGRISSSAHARTITRRNLIAAIQNNPTLAKELISAQSSIMGLPGGADITSQGSQMEQDAISRRSGLISEGLLPFDASEDQFRRVDYNVRMGQEATRQHQLRMNTLDEELKIGNVTSARRKQIEEERVSSAVDLMRNTAQVEQEAMRARFDQILNDPSLSEAQKTMALEDTYADWRSQVSTVVGEVGAERGSAYLKPFEMLYETYQKRMTGELGDAEVERGIERALNAAKVIAVADPEIARLATASSLFGQSGLMDILVRGNPSVSKSFLDFVAGANPDNRRGPANPYVSQAEDREGLRAALSSVTSALKSPDPEVREAGEIGFEKFLQSFEDYEAMLRRDPSSGIEVVNWLASTDFLEARNLYPEAVENSPLVRDVIQRNFSDEVWGMVQTEFVNRNVSFVSADPEGASGRLGDYRVSVPSNQTVQARATGSGVEFVPIDPSHRAHVDEARRLNRDLAPVINNTLKAGAHLEGRTDYGNVWNEVAQQLGMGTYDETSAINLDDFLTRGAPLTSLAGSERLLNLMDSTEGGGEYNTLFGFSHRGGGAFSGVDVSQMTIGQALRFASPQGEYGQWVKRELGRSGQQARVATPMGRYQIVGTTLRQAAREMGLDENTRFDSRTQDAIFVHLAEKALSGKSTMSAKRNALRGVWEGFKHASNAELDAAIREFESS